MVDVVRYGYYLVASRGVTTSSVTVQVTVVFPIGKLAGALLFTLATEQLSAVVGVPKATPVATHVPAPTFTLTAEGQVIVGLMLSVTVTIWSQVAVLPLPSVTVQVTVVFPIGKLAGALLFTLATEQLSL